MPALALAAGLTGVFVQAGCGHGRPSQGLKGPGAPEQGHSAQSLSDAAKPAEPAELATAATASQVTRPEHRRQAAQALAQGLSSYHRGDYSAAQVSFKEALLLNPFLAPAHLTLGKIVSLRALAAGDGPGLQAARRMVQMAVRLDPGCSDARSFLALLPKNP